MTKLTIVALIATISQAHAAEYRVAIECPAIVAPVGTYATLAEARMNAEKAYQLLNPTAKSVCEVNISRH